MDENQFKQALETILDDLKTKLENSKGIAVFVDNRAKFEGWLKVEIVDILCNKMNPKKITPEAPDNNENITSEENKNYQHIDIVFDDSALELKAVNTSYREESIENKTRPITDNVNQLVKDIKKLRELNRKDIKNKAILFVVFPLSENNIKKFEAKHLPKLGVEKQDIMYRQFNTVSCITNRIITNRIYCVIVREK
jgi:hypothetical protein